MPDFENLDFKIASGLKQNPNSEHQVASHRSRRQSSIREAITCRQTDCLDDVRLRTSQPSVWPHSQGSRTLRLAVLRTLHCLGTFRTAQEEGSCMRRTFVNGCHLCKGQSSLYQKSCASATEGSASAHETDWLQFGSVKKTIVTDPRATKRTSATIGLCHSAVVVELMV